MIESLSSLPLLSNFENTLQGRIKRLKGRMHTAHNPIYNESLLIQIETLQWALSQVNNRSKQAT